MRDIPAFPSAPIAGATDERQDQRDGMSLRDYLAAKAMHGLCANPGAAFQANARTGWGLVNVGLDEVAALSYDMADAMLKARG